MKRKRQKPVTGDEKEVYLLKVYRRSRKESGCLVGTIEEIGSMVEKVFLNMEELGQILRMRAPEPEGASAKERRAFERHQTRLPVLVNGVSASGKRFTEESITKDISPMGAYILLENRVAMDTKLRLRIDPAHSGLEIKGRVVRVADGPEVKGVGVSFERMV